MVDIIERINKDMNSRPSEVTSWRATMHDARDEIERLRAALKAAKEKLAIYRAERKGEYTGGMEYTALMKLIDAALEQKEPRNDII